MAEMKPHWIRCSDDTWDKSVKRAKSEGSSASERVREFLDEYANDVPPINEELARVINQLRVIRKRLAIGDE